MARNELHRDLREQSQEEEREPWYTLTASGPSRKSCEGR